MTQTQLTEYGFINKGLGILLRQRLSKIEEAIDKGKTDISKETLDYLKVYEIALSEKADVSAYEEKHHSLIKRLYKEKIK
jgi:hypothetical protein